MELADSYRRYLGKKLTSLVWRPITCDTPGLVDSLGDPMICYSGATSMNFEDSVSLSLTWKNESICHLGLMEENDWNLSALDLIHASPEEPWRLILNCKLKRVSLYCHDTTNNKTVAAKHEFKNDGSLIDFWIGVGSNKSMHEADDLVVCVASSPSNFDELKLRERIEK